MCEIAAINPTAHSIDAQTELATNLYAENDDGLGVAAVYNEGDHFEYDVAKAETPSWQDVIGWLDDHDDAWRIIMHARITTAGGNGFHETHPLRVACDKTDVEWVIHNGQVYNHRSMRRKLQSKGHFIKTEVDSEVIAHAHGEVPNTLDDDEFDEPRLKGRLNYLLLGRNGILVRNTGKYQIDHSLKMMCSHREFEAPDRNDEGFMLFRPDGVVETADADVSGSYSWGETRGNSYIRTKYKPKGRTGSGTGNAASGNEQKSGSKGSSQSTTSTKHEAVRSVTDRSTTYRFEWWYETKENSRHDYFCSIHRNWFNDECRECIKDVFTLSEETATDMTDD